MLSAYAPLSLMLEASEKSMAKSEIRRFLNLTTILLNQGDLEEALEQLHYMSEKLDTATEAEFEYIDVYYTEHNLKKLYLDFHGKPPRVVV